VKSFLLRAAKEIALMVVFAAVFSLLFIVGSLVLYQEWPRWK
jgi:hypothetical protein